MSEIGAYEAKTHLPQILDRVQKGERFVITKHGRPVTELVPIAERGADQVKRVIGEIRALRKALASRGVRLKDILGEGESLRDLAHESHRYAKLRQACIASKIPVLP